MISRRPDADASRRTILDAARGCFAAAGFAGTSMSDIAAAASVTQSLIHHHFGSKEALWREVRLGAVAQYQRRVAEAIAGEGPTREAMAALFRYFGDNPDVVRLCAWAQLSGESSGEPGDAPSDPVGAIARAQAEGRIRGDVPAGHLLVALTGLVRNWFEDRSLVGESGPRPAHDAPSGLDAVDEAYLDAVWRVFEGGASSSGAA